MLVTPLIPPLAQGNLTVNWSSNYYILSQRHEAVPRLTPAHLEVCRTLSCAELGAWERALTFANPGGSCSP